MKEIGKLLELYRAYLTDDIKRDMYVNGADEKLIDLVEAEEVEEEDLYKFLNQLSVLKKFIEWLVREDKIDFEGKLNTLRFESLVDQTLDSYLALLMLLSISNSPIEDLLLYLK